MWLLFLNSLKGIAKKKMQMAGVIFLILVSSAVYTTMNSTLDRMDGMSAEYLENQKVEHMTILLNEIRALYREDYSALYNDELNDEWNSIIVSIAPFDDQQLVMARMSSPQIVNALDAVVRPIVELSVPLETENRTEVVNTQVNTILKQRLAYMFYLVGILSGTYPANEVNAYLFYGCASRARSPETTNVNPALPWATFCPSNPIESQEGSTSNDFGFGDSTTGNVAKLQAIMEQMAVDPKYSVDKYTFLNQTMDELGNEYNFTYVLQVSKTVNYYVGDDPKQYSLGVKVYNPNVEVNIPYLIKGRFPIADDEITVSDRFAQSNDLDINDTYMIEDKTYTVVGFAYAPDYIYPAISFNTPLYDRKRHSVVFTNQATFDDFEGKITKTYSARFNDYHGSATSDELIALCEEVQENKKVIFVLSTATFQPRISTFTSEIKNNRVFTSYFMYVLLAISIFIIIMIMKKRIEDERLQIGVLKSLGYKTTSIAAGYLVYPVIGALLGATLGYLLGLALQTPLVDMYKSYYNIPMDAFKVDPKYFLIAMGISLVVLVMLSYLVALYMLRHRPLKLLKEGSNLKINRFTKWLGKVLRLLHFKQRFKYSLASRSLGKLITITLCSFSTGLLIVLTLIGATMMNDFVEKSFAGSEYDYRVSYASIQDPQAIVDYDEEHSGEDLVLSYSLNIIGVIREDNTMTPFDSARQVSLNGIDSDLNLIKITNRKDEDISHLLFIEDGIHRIIVNDTIRVLYDLKIGQTIVLAKKVNTGSGSNYSNEIQFVVAGVNETFSGLNSYVSKSSLTDYLGFSNESYNLIYTNRDTYDISDDRISNIFRIEDLKQNIRMAIEMANISLYVIIGFAGLMALIIISVVSNIVVDENRKHISLMKVMGYKDKEISSIVLNIYTPFVIVAYLLSIPAMIGILKFIVSLLAKELDFSLPIAISFPSAMIGFAVILTSYFIALVLSRRSLNKVSLAEALKRE